MKKNKNFYFKHFTRPWHSAVSRLSVMRKREIEKRLFLAAVSLRESRRGGRRTSARKRIRQWKDFRGTQLSGVMRFLRHRWGGGSTAGVFSTRAWKQNGNGNAEGRSGCCCCCCCYYSRRRHRGGSTWNSEMAQVKWTFPSDAEDRMSSLCLIKLPTPLLRCSWGRCGFVNASASRVIREGTRGGWVSRYTRIYSGPVAHTCPEAEIRPSFAWLSRRTIVSREDTRREERKESNFGGYVRSKARDDDVVFVCSPGKDFSLCTGWTRTTVHHDFLKNC